MKRSRFELGLTVEALVSRHVWDAKRESVMVPITLPLVVQGLTLAPVSTYKFSKLISIHFLKELVERICSKIKVFSLG